MDRPVFSSRLASVLTLIGVAVGLGNVWRFPYMMGEYGGSAFLAVYLLFMFIFAIPALMAEIAIGRETRGGTLAAFRAAFGRRAGSFVGFLLLVTILIASSYYAVVVGNVLYTTVYSIGFGFGGANNQAYSAGLANGWLQYGITIALVSSALFVVYKGLKSGIERVSKIIVPFFVIALLYLIAQSLMLPGAVGKLTEFLRPDFAALTPLQIFAALGQSFFSVGLGGTFMVVYGSYLKSEEDIPRIAAATGLGDLGASLLASLFLVPAILVFGLDLASGPGLIFATLPNLFGQMDGGWLVGSLFLAALSSVAFLSMIAAYQVLVGSLDREVLKDMPRGKIVFGVGVAMAALTLPVSLRPDIIGVLDMIFGSGMQVLGSLLAVAGLVWGLGKVVTLGQLNLSGTKGSLLYYWLKWLIPAVLAAVLSGYVISQFSTPAG